MADDQGTVVTVRGPIDPDDLGETLPHEHTFIDMLAGWFEEPDHPEDRRLSREPMTLELFGHVRLNPQDNRDNMRLESMDDAIEELRKYRLAGGDAVVDVTPKNIGADPVRVRKIGRATGLTFVHGTAHYTRASHTDHVDDSSQEELEEEFVSDVREGIDDTDVRAGLVGEIGLSGTIHEQEEKVLRAAASAARRTGAPLNIHPPLFGPEPSPRAALGALDIIEEEGLDLDRVVVSHMDQDHHATKHLEDHFEIAERGAYLELDEWDGWDMYMPDEDHAYPGDATRVDAVVELFEQGYGSRVLLSHDVCTKMQRTKYGGKGYAYLHEHVLPWLQSRGLSEEDVELMTVENPKRVLTFDEPAPN